jgi:cephalosporin-C deacetylase-like acetyl esterase
VRVLDELLSAPPRAGMVPAFILARADALAVRSGDPSPSVSPEARDVLRRRLRDALGLDRVPRTDRCELRGRIERDGYVIEKLVYEATPGLPVPAHLYLPDGPGPHPAVVHAPGHWMENAKLEPNLQRFNAHLARNGVVVLCYDTLGQGERRIGWHQHGQLAPLLVGFTSLGLMVRDSLAALDLLELRDEVDAARLGMTGTSGGGYSTIFASALDERIRAAAIACIVNTHAGGMRDAALGTGWDGWIDLCNQVPRLCAAGTMGEILASAAPRSLRIVHAMSDPSFPIGGAREVADEVARLYAANGARDAFSYVEVPGAHGLHRAVREALSSFLVSGLRKGLPASEREVDLLDAPWEVTHEPARAERPQRRRVGASAVGACLPEPLDSNAPVVELARRRAAQLRASRVALSTDALADVLGPFPPRRDLRPTVTNHLAIPGGFAQRLTLTPEPGIALDALVLLPEEWSDSFPPVFVMLDEGGKAQALAAPEVARAREWGCAVLLPDLRGTGESAVSEFEVSSAAWMLDRDLLNQRVWDVLRVVDYLSERYSSSQQIDKGRIVVWGRDAFGLVAVLAAALDPRIAGTGATGLGSLEELLVQDSSVTPMAYRHGLLEQLDLADLVQLMRPRPAVVGVAASDARSAVDKLLALAGG